MNAKTATVAVQKRPVGFCPMVPILVMRHSSRRPWLQGSTSSLMVTVSTWQTSIDLQLCKTNILQTQFSLLWCGIHWLCIYWLVQLLQVDLQIIIISLKEWCINAHLWDFYNNYMTLPSSHLLLHRDTFLLHPCLPYTCPTLLPLFDYESCLFHSFPPPPFCRLSVMTSVVLSRTT